MRLAIEILKVIRFTLNLIQNYKSYKKIGFIIFVVHCHKGICRETRRMIKIITKVSGRKFFEMSVVTFIYMKFNEINLHD